MKNWIAGSLLALASTASWSQANGITLDLEEQSPLSKWGRWTSGTEKLDKSLHSGKNKSSAGFMGFHANDLVFKMNRDNVADQNDLFFGLRVREDAIGTTALGCMSSNRKTYNKTATSSLCGVQLDVKLP